MVFDCSDTFTSLLYKNNDLLFILENNIFMHSFSVKTKYELYLEQHCIYYLDKDFRTYCFNLLGLKFRNQNILLESLFVLFWNIHFQSSLSVSEMSDKVVRPASPSPSISLLEIKAETRLVLKSLLRHSLSIAQGERPGRIGGAYKDPNKFRWLKNV